VGYTTGSTGNVTLDGNGSVNMLTTYSPAQVMNLGYVSGSQGTLQIGENDAYTGSLGIKAVSGGAGTAKVILDQTNSFTLSFSLTGSLSFQQKGTGTTTLSAAANSNTYTGGTVVSAGMLLVNTAAGTGTGTVEVQSGGTIGGTGSITGALAIDGGGTLAPGSSTFAANGGISLADNSQIAFTLGTTSNKVTDAGALSLGQDITLSLTPGSGFGVGTYSLINFGGSLTDNSSSFSGWTVSGLPGTYTAHFALAGSALQLDVVSVPEPASSLALALGLVICASQRRRRAWTNLTAHEPSKGPIN
jgi:fibronectin-binding autotransporter adhesin